MPFGASGQKFPMGGLGFEGQQGMGSSPGGLLGNDMVMYPTYDKTSSLYSLFMAFFLLLHLAYLNTRLVGGSGLERGLLFICPQMSCWWLLFQIFCPCDVHLLAGHPLQLALPDRIMVETINLH